MKIIVHLFKRCITHLKSLYKAFRSRFEFKVKTTETHLVVEIGKKDDEETTFVQSKQNKNNKEE